MPLFSFLSFGTTYDDTVISKNVGKPTLKKLKRRGSFFLEQWNLPPGYGTEIVEKLSYHSSFELHSSLGNCNYYSHLSRSCSSVKSSKGSIFRRSLPLYEIHDTNIMRCNSAISPDNNNNFPRSSPQPEPEPETRKLKKWSLDTYDGNAIEEYYNRNWWEVVERLALIGPPMVSWYLGIKADNVTNSMVGQDVKAERELKRAIQLR